MDNGALNIFEANADGLNIEYEIVIPKELTDEDRFIRQFYEDYAKTVSEVDRLTNTADGLDYALAAASGVIAGIIDVFFVGELGLFEAASEEAKKKFISDKGKTHERINRYIENYAKKKGYEGKGLKGAIAFLENKYPVAQDNIWKGKQISSTKTHHLDDLAHHPTLLGLISSILVQYLRISVFANKSGEVDILIIEIDGKEFAKNLFPIILSGFIKWILYQVERKELVQLDDELPKPIQMLVEKIYVIPEAISILKTIDNWYGHLVSDMGGSKNTAGGGTGIPGLFLSFFKEISMLPGIRDSELPKLLNDLYQGNKTSPLVLDSNGKPTKLDLRTEITVFEEQKLPVYVNEILVRSTYFISHLIRELQANELKNVDWKNIVPFYNRTIIRMITISTSTMEAIDLADAAIRAAIKSGGIVPGFAIQFVMRINFVGLGRLTIACVTDGAMGMKKSRLETALVSADVAIAADEMVATVDKIDVIKKNTDKKIKKLSSQTKEMSGFKF